ncbi:N-terminal domain of peptidoglycan hydrolase CwlO-containing protein [Pelagirhabdus alkalitolerans]|uniref:N-terminal domain of peptidoglycan hydrolase CwlO-containing protein n=1 Tax=Pelagirhabdus alkalitolerans TaxID=1612202 RepID=A0A1G6KBL5_9BACI|nr:C40 family peptidase [Pelagirhabdus alkalitolerans]SDC28317.1 N-terminal domain of peptidoglycan hydrolase CwlO-containing protein [Pelagirhabdus alkalitolerans]
MNLKKITVSLAVTASIVFVSPSINQVVNANPSEIEEDREQIQAELEEKREELESIQADLVELEDEIERANDQIEANEEKIEKTEAEVEEAEAEIEELEEEIEELEEDIERRLDIVKDRASSLQKNGGSVSYLDVLFGAQSFTDFIDRVTMVSRITQSDQNLIEQLETDQNTVKEQKEEVEDKLSDLEETQSELVLMQGQIEEQKEALEDDVESLEEKQESSESIIAELELEEDELDQMLADARREREREQEEERQEMVDSSSSSNGNSNSGEVTQFSSSNNSSPSTASAGSGAIETAITAGYKYLNGNSTYVFGAGRTQSDINRGLFDCSGYVSWAFSEAGINIPASTGQLANTGTRVSTSDMQPGDLVFFDTYQRNGHVGIYKGGGEFIGAQTTPGVSIESLNSGYWGDTFNGLVRRVH